MIATSFDRENRVRIDSRSQGPDAFLSKPYSKSQLLHAISRLLTGSAGRRCKIVPFGGHERQANKASGQAFDRKDRSDSGESAG